MYKNQLQELAQRSCFNLPSYTCIREGPDHAPRFKAAVNFNGETFESPNFCSTLRQAEHSAAAVALNALASRGPSNSLAARVLDETGVYKNLLQEVSQRVGASLPVYTTFRTGLGHLPVFTCTVELAGVVFTGEPAKNKKQAEKNAAMAAWLSLKSLVQGSETPNQKTHKDEQEHAVVARAFHGYLIKARLAKLSFPIKFPVLNPRPTSASVSPAATSKILPLISPHAAHGQRLATVFKRVPAFQSIMKAAQTRSVGAFQNESDVGLQARQCSLHNRLAPPVTIRNAVPVFSAPPPPPRPAVVITPPPPPLGVAQPVSLKNEVSAFSAPVGLDELSRVHAGVKAGDMWIYRPLQLQESLASKLTSSEVEERSCLKSLPVSAEPNPQDPADQNELPAAEARTVLVKPPTKAEEALPCLNVRDEESKMVQELRSIDIGGSKDLK